MKNKSLILSLFLVLIIFLGSSTVFAEDSSDMQISSTDEIDMQESTDVPEITSKEYTVTAGSNSEQIQDTINSMTDGDTLNFESGTYNDICIYIANKSITVNGNGAILKGYDTPSKNIVPEKIKNDTNKSGYGISNLATLYIVKSPKVTINGLTLIGGEHSGSSTDKTLYSNCMIYIEESNNLTLSKNKIDGSSWGIYLKFSNDCTIAENTIQNQKVTGILNFGSARTIIKDNMITNAFNHGIDVRHSTGPNVQVINNTVIGSKEGIYLMHSKGHTAAKNTLINCTISSISCYGSSNINLYNNTIKKSRIGILLGGGYSNINIGTNTFDLDNLPYPPTFVYYVAEAKTDYQTTKTGIYSDISSYSPNYIEYNEIPTATDITVNYSEILKETGNVYNVSEGATSSDIQTIIDSMSNGDTLKFTKNAVYNNISIYTDKNIKIIGNNATLIGYNIYDAKTIPTKVKALTNESGYAISEHAVLYILNNTDVVICDLNIIAKYPGYDTTNVTTKTMNYKTAGIRAQNSANLTITNCVIDGASWGIYMEYSKNAKITNNEIKNQYTTGILNFGSPQSIIANNTITNAENHGIDVRHGTGPNVIVFNNTITGAKEGIYLMHSKGHKVYNNTIIDSKISSITCYGSGNEIIFDNILKGSRIGILLGGGYYNVTIGNNTYELDYLPFPPTFVTYIARADSRYQSANNVIGIYSDKAQFDISVASPVKTNEPISIKVLDINGNPVVGKDLLITIDGSNHTATTENDGIAKVMVNLKAGTHTVKVTAPKTADDYKETSVELNVTVTEEKTTSTQTSTTKTTKITPKATKITAKKKTFKVKVKVKKYTITLKAGKNPVKKVWVTLKIKGKKVIKAKTNSKGKATFKIKTLKKKGKYTATIKFAGNKNFKASSKKVKITVKK